LLPKGQTLKKFARCRAAAYGGVNELVGKR